MLTGSFASSLHGVPRATFDADVVIEARPADLDAFVAENAGRFYVSPEAAREALRREGMFNLIHLATGFKIDLIVRKSRAFSRSEFSRAQFIRPRVSEPRRRIGPRRAPPRAGPPVAGTIPSP